MKKVILGVVVALNLSIILIPVWIWALFGMSGDVGTAWFVTNLCVFPITMTVGMWSLDV